MLKRVPGEEPRAARRVLAIEDDVELCSLMKDFFAPRGIAIEAVHDGPRGLARALQGSFDLIILDVMLPVLDGFELLRQLRKRSSVPVIMLTARVAQQDRVSGLEAGADDYLPKPFGPEELLARMRAVWRRTNATGSLIEPDIRHGALILSPRNRTVSAEGRRVTLTSVEYDILECLMRSPGRVVSRDHLCAVLHQRTSTPYERSLDVHISHLRRKLGPHDEALIQTVRGVGYRFAPDTETSE